MMIFQTIEIQSITKQYGFDSFLTAGNQSLFSAIQSIMLRNSVIQTNIALTLDEIVKLVKKENEINKLSEEDINNLNRISTILYEAGQVQNWWKEERLISREESNKLCNWLKLFYNKL